MWFLKQYYSSPEGLKNKETYLMFNDLIVMMIFPSLIINSILRHFLKHEYDDAEKKY